MSRHFRRAEVLPRKRDVEDRDAFDEVTFEQTMLEYVQVIRTMQLDKHERRGHTATTVSRMIHVRCMRLRIRMKKTLLPKQALIPSQTPLAGMKK